MLAVQVGFAMNGYRDPHKFFAFQPFNESSTWRADIVRVTSSGERVPIDGGWAGYTWNELVDMSALQGPSGTRHAYMGVGATIDFLDEALDWVATHTPDDRETRYLEADRHDVREHTRPDHHRVAQRRARRAVSTAIVEPAEGRARRTRWDDVLDWSGSVRAIAVMRIAIGPITLLHLRPFLRDAAAGVSYDDHFWQPFVSWLPELPAGVWFALLWVGAVAAVLMTIGLWTRLATVTAFAVVAGNLLLSQTHFRHNRTFLVIVLGGLALLPAGRVLSVDAWRRRRAGRAAAPDVAPLWPLWLLRVQVCLVYLASGIEQAASIPTGSAGSCSGIGSCATSTSSHRCRSGPATCSSSDGRSTSSGRRRC